MAWLRSIIAAVRRRLIRLAAHGSKTYRPSEIAAIEQRNRGRL